MLKRLELTQFRSHKKSTFEFAPQTTIIIGPNGAGKTNIIEAIYILSQGKSFIGSSLKDVINWDTSDFALIKASTEEHELEYVLDNRTSFKRIAKIDHGKIALKYFAGRLPVVLFEPMDLHLVTGSPSLRREFLDRIISQVSLEYRTSSKHFQRLLTQRNALLKKIRSENAHPSELKQWDMLLAPLGTQIITMRKKLFGFIQEHCIPTVHLLSDSKHIVEYNYLPSLRHEEHYLEMLRDNEHADIAAGMTLIGPHRDDFSIAFDGREARTFASRGEQRLCCIALLMLERLLINEYLQTEPVFLCDDVLSELDEPRQKLFLNAINNCQVIITSATEIPVVKAVNRIELTNI